jgi:hypothetical protein
MEILFLALVFGLGFFAGWLRASKSILDRMLSKPEEMMDLLKKYKEVKDEVETGAPNSSSIRELEIHNEKGAFYLFAKDNGQFLGQGTSIEEALEAVRSRFPGQNFAGHIPAEEAKAMGLSKQI